MSGSGSIKWHTRALFSWVGNLVTWRANETPRVLRSAAAVRTAQRAGDVTIKVMPIVVNCPVL